MAIDLRDIKKARQRELDSREETRSIIPAIIIERNGSVHPPNLPNYVWIRENNQPEGAGGFVFNDEVNPVANLPVLVGPDPQNQYKRKVLGVYVGGIMEGETGNVGLFNVPPHGQTHQIPSEDNPGSDPVKIYQPAIQILKTTGNGSNLTITTQSYIYHKDGVRYYFPGATTDLTSSVPGAGLVRRSLVYLDTNTNTIQVLDGTPVLDNGIIPIPYPDIPEDAVPSAYVKLSNGQSAVTTVDDVDDSRDFLNAGSEPYDADEEGQFLFSTDAITFEPRIPVSTRFGIVLNAEGKVVVV